MRASRSALFAIFFILLSGGCDDDPAGPDTNDNAGGQGAQVFRYDTFGNEDFWTDTLQMHQVIETAVDPTTALSVGLKVDIDNLPPNLLAGADLNSPATTIELLRRDAVVGLKASVTGQGKIERVGITCALCHSTVDNSVMAGVGRRLDGYANVDLDPGRIIALSPYFDDKPAIRSALQSWGPGKYDAYFNHDGISDPVVIPPAYGLQDVTLETYTGEGEISYWNAYVAVTQMHGKGNFMDPRLGIDIRSSPDLVTPKLPDLREYQLSLETPDPPNGSFDPLAATRGQAVFNGKAQCATCHAFPTFSDAAVKLHDPSETGMDPLRAQRGTTGGYRTTPLRGLWQHPPYFHDGSAATLNAVISHYEGALGFTLNEADRADLLEYLKSL